MSLDNSQVESLVALAAGGDDAAKHELLSCQRARLRRMVALRMDRRLSGRIDPSDVVQDVLAEASQNLDKYLAQPPLPFYAWLRQFAFDRIIELKRHHLGAQKRSVNREERTSDQLPDDSVNDLAARLISDATTPTAHARREEVREKMRKALDCLTPADREVLVLRYLEQLSIHEIAAVAGLTEGAVKSRHMRALMRLRTLLESSEGKATS